MATRIDITEEFYMLKQYVSQEHDRVVKWIEGGRIVHTDLSGRILAVEPHSKKAITKIIKFLEKKTPVRVLRVGGLNKPAQELLSEVSGLDVREEAGFIMARVNNTAGATNKISRSLKHPGKYDAETITVNIRPGDRFESNTRYELIFGADGTIQFERFEAIMPENLNVRHEQPLLSIYTTEV